ncbi:MAG: diguanylate cyclase [Actinomycetes bacterium]
MNSAEQLVTWNLPKGALVYEADRWRAMANQHPALLWVSDTSGMCTGFNDAWLTWRGRTLVEESGTGWLTGVHPDDADACMSTYLGHFAECTPFEMTYRLQRADGAYRLILDAGAPWFASDGEFAGFVGSCLDITDHIAAARRLAETEELYRATVAGLHEGVVVADGEGIVLSANPAAARLLGVEADDMLGRPMLDLAERVPFVNAAGQPVDTHERPFAVVQQTGEPVVDAVMGWMHRGELRWHNVNSRPLRHEGEDRIVAVVTSFVDVTDQKHATDDARYQARHDSLTGLVNRWGLRDHVRQVLERSPRAGADVALAYCDLDNFKHVNDSLGHAGGDELLRVVAARVAACVRSGDVVARVGGDEIVIVLSGVSGLPGAITAAEKIRVAVSSPVEIAGATATPRLSIGVSLLESLDVLDQSLDRADEAMYVAKAAGRDRVAALPD